MNQTAAQNLMERGATLRAEIFGGVTVTYDKKFVTPGYSSSVRKGRKLELVGFLAPHDCVVRIPKTCGFVPEVGKPVKITFTRPPFPTFELQIDEFPHGQLGVEWALGCKSLY